MAAVEGIGWDAFVGWAKLFRSTPNFELDARVNKMRAIERVADARVKLTASDFWLDTLMRGFRTPDNLFVPQKVYVPFLDWLSKNTGPAAGALRDLWSVSVDGPYGAAIDHFWAALPNNVVPDADHRANVASFLLAAIDPETFALYRPSVVDTSYEQTSGEEPAKDATPGDRYDAAIAWLDQFIAEAGERGLAIANRLEAAALANHVTSAPTRPSHWDLDTWDDFVAYRSTPQRVAKKTAVAAARAASSATKAAARKRTSGTAAPRAKRATVVTKPTRAPRGVCPLCGSDEEVRLVGQADGGRWAFVCEGGFAHDDDFAFTMAGTR